MIKSQTLAAARKDRKKVFSRLFCENFAEIAIIRIIVRVFPLFVTFLNYCCQSAIFWTTPKALRHLVSPEKDLSPSFLN